MTESQRKSLGLSEARSALNTLIEKRNKLPNDQEPTADDTAAMDTATRKVSALEVEYRAALVTEHETETRRAAEGPDGEEMEKRRLLTQAKVLNFVGEAVDGRRLDGAELEVRKAVLGDEANDCTMPVDLLLPAAELEHRASNRTMEHRADSVTPVAAAALSDGSDASVLERVFTRSIAARLGVAMPSVPVGAAVFPIMSGGTTAREAADGNQVDAGAGTFTGHTLEPTRLTAAYLFNARQQYQLANFEAVLRRDLTAVISDHMDNEILNGNGTAPNVNGFKNELAAPTDVTAATTFSQWLAIFTGSVDGLNAFTMNDLRAVIGKDTYEHAYSLYKSAESDIPGLEFVGSRIGGMSVSSRVTGKNASNQQNNIMALTSYPGRNAVAPIWRGMELIRDPYTNAGKGQVRLTAILFWSFKVLRETGWKLFQVRTA